MEKDDLFRQGLRTLISLLSASHHRFEKREGQHQEDPLDDPADETDPYCPKCAVIIQRLSYRNHHCYKHPDRGGDENNLSKPREDAQNSYQPGRTGEADGPE